MGNRTLRHKRLALAIGVLAFALALPSLCHAAIFGNFTVATPSAEAVTMGDAADTLSFTVTNDAASTKNIRTVFFNADNTLYDFSAATVAPNSCTNPWNVQPNKAACSLPGCISFTSGGGIPPGGSCTFDIVVTGAGDTAIFTNTQDQTDTLLAVVASTNAGANQQKGEFTLVGGLPTWQRKSLAVALTASPISTGVGGQIVVTMTVTNRSSAIQSGVVGCDPAAACPSFPAPVGASVTGIGSPVYGSSTYTTNPNPAILKNDMDAVQTTARVLSTAGFPASGRLLIGTELVDYTGTTGNSFTGASRGVGGTTAASHFKWDVLYGQNTSAFTLDPGEASTITWIFQAGAAGEVYFRALSNDTTGNATSKVATSNTVIIGDFTALTTVSPLSVISGQTVTVLMDVYNNGSTTLTNITPSLSAGGSATATLASGPDPASIATLPSGDTGQFEWQYVITGTLGQTFNFTGSATSDTVGTNPSTSETGVIVVYAVSVNPALLSTGATNVTLTWTVYNNAVIEVKQVQIDISPIVDGTCGTNRWVYGSHAAPANWSSATVGAPVSGVVFTADPPTGTNGILQGQSKDFSITFTCAPDVMADTTFNFPVTITDKSNNTATIETDVMVTAYEVTIEAFNDDCSTALPPWDPADGYSQYCFVATLTKGGVAAPNEPLTFTTTAGALAPIVGFTNASGIMEVILTAPCSTIDVSPTVEARYVPDTTASVTVTFLGIADPILQYVPGSLVFNRTAPAPTGDRTVPVSIDTGDTGAFRLDVTNCGASDITIHPTDTDLAILSGGSDTFALDSLVDITISSLGTATLTFVSGTIASGPLQCYPVLTVDAEYAGPIDYTGPYAFDKAPPGDSISDTVTVSGGTECAAIANIRMLDWMELY